MQPGQQQPPAYQQSAPQQQTMLVQQQQQQPVVAVRQDTSGMTNSQNGSRKWCWKGLRVTGYMQVVLGCLAVLFGIISIVVRTYLFFVGTPIWSGICFFVITGILGIAAGRKQRSGLIVGYMVMSIISSVVGAAVLGVGAGVIAPDLYFCPDRWFSHRSYYYSYGCSTSSGARVGIDVCILLIGLAECVIAIVGASFTCVSLSVSRNSTPRTVVAYQAYRQPIVVGQPPQGVYYPPGANVAYPNQFVMQPQAHFVVQGQPQYVMQPQAQYVVQPTQMYQAQPQGQFQPLPQGQMQPPPQGQVQPPPQGQMQPPPQGQMQPPAQGQIQPPPQGQLQPSPQGPYPPRAEDQIHPEAPLSNEENLKQPLTN